MRSSLVKPLMVILALLVLLAGLTLSKPTLADSSLRVQLDQHGDFVLIGNTFGYECAAASPPVLGTVDNCGTNTADTSPDVFWRSDAPVAGQAQANTGISAAQARSTAILTLPPGAQVTHAYLYWTAALAAPGSDLSATLDRPGTGGFTSSITALESLTITNNGYRSVADVTALVQANGPGAYRVSDVDIINWVDAVNLNAFGAWWMVVLYELDTDPLRTLTIYDGMDPVLGSGPLDTTLSGFRVPPGPIDARLGLAMLGGDSSITDSITFNGTPLANGQNPANNFFNGTRSYLGAPVSVAGDLPQLDGMPGSMAGLDLDVVDVAPYLTTGQTSALITTSQFGDLYFQAMFVSSIKTYSPDVSTSTKTVVDLNGGTLLPGDLLEYTLAITNTGNDTATLTLLNDPLPVGVAYDPGSLEVVSGANAGTTTDASGDDQAEYIAASRSIVMRLGDNAAVAQGGSLGLAAATRVRFRVTLDATCAGPFDIANQASLSAIGQLSGTPINMVTDGNGPAAGRPPTNVNFSCLSIYLPLLFK